MEEFNFRSAKNEDIPFLVDTIIEAEKSGTTTLSYTTVFGLPESEARKYIADMLAEGEDDCELSVSSYLLAESNNETAAAIGAWVEGAEGIPSAIIKGNLLNFTLPGQCIRRAMAVNKIVNKLHIEQKRNSIQIGVVYVAEKYRGKNLVNLLIEKQIEQLQKSTPGIKMAYVQVFANNLPAIKAYEKANFSIALIKESSDKSILKYLPSERKILMQRKLVN